MFASFSTNDLNPPWLPDMPSLRMHNVINIERMSREPTSDHLSSLKESILIDTDQFSMTLPHPLVVPLECDDVTEIATVCQHIHWGKVDDWHFSERTALGDTKVLGASNSSHRQTL